MAYTTRVSTGHDSYLMHISPCSVFDIPSVSTDRGWEEHKNNFHTYYAVRNGSENGVIFMYIAKGHRDAPRQVCVFYRNGEMWNSYGTNFQEAIEGAIRDAWKDGIREA